MNWTELWNECECECVSECVYQALFFNKFIIIIVGLLFWFDVLSSLSPHDLLVVLNFHKFVTFRNLLIDLSESYREPGR